MKIPKSGLISGELVANTPIGRVIKEGLNRDSRDHCMIAGFLLLEMGKENSQWDGYIRSLPTTFHSFPIFYTPEDEVWLAGSPMRSRLIEKRVSLTEDWKALVTLAPELEMIPESIFFQVRMLVSSRSFSVHLTLDPTPCLVPLADLLNHSFSPNVSWTYSGSSFEVRSLQDVQIQTSLTCSYGKKSNSALLLNYGFVIPDNPYNDYPFSISLTNLHPNFALKSALLNDHIHRTFLLPVHYIDSVLNRLLGFCRFIELTDMRELPKILAQCQNQDSGEFDPELTPAISLINEYRVFRALKVAVSACFHQYETSLLEDEGLLGTELTENQRNCVVLRKGEKAILDWVLDFIETVLIWLDRSDVNRLPQEGSGPYYQYFSQFAVSLLHSAGL